MTEETKGVEENSPTPLAEAIASSPEALEAPIEETQDTETASETTESPEEQQAEESRVPYSRLKEVVDEKNWYKTQLEQRLSQQTPQQPQQPQAEPYAGFSPEEERFWRAVDQRAAKVADERLGKIAPVIDAGRMELAQMKVQQFRTAHPDIKSNSPEEIQIAEKIQMGYLPEDAYKTVMWDKKVAQAEKQTNSNKQVKIEAKKQANVENKSTPSGVNTHVKETLSLKERIRREADKLDWSE